MFKLIAYTRAATWTTTYRKAVRIMFLLLLRWFFVAFVVAKVIKDLSNKSKH